MTVREEFADLLNHPGVYEGYLEALRMNQLMTTMESEEFFRQYIRSNPTSNYEKFATGFSIGRMEGIPR